MQGLPDILKSHNLQSLNKALDLLIEFKFCDGGFYFLLSKNCMVATCNFGSVYTTLPHNLIKEKLTELIEQTFNREGSLYLACNDKMPFLLLNNLNDINCGHVRKCVMRSIIFWTIYL